MPPYKEGNLGIWETASFDNLTADMTVNAIYYPLTVNEQNGTISNIPPYTTVDMLKQVYGDIASEVEGNLACGDTLLINGKTYIAIVAGDVNCDKEITAADAAEILRGVVKLSKLNEYQSIAANIRAADEYTSADAALVLRFIVKIEKFLGVTQ